jgi:hypothetical protein
MGMEVAVGTMSSTCHLRSRMPDIVQHPHLAILHVVLQASASMVGWAGSSLLLLVTSYSSVSTSPNVHVSDQQSLWHTWIGSTSCCMSRPPFQGFPASVVACPVPCTAVPVQWCRQR